MAMRANQEASAARRDRESEGTDLSRAAQGWVNQLARTLKTCRLYDANNPTVVRFREDLSSSLRELTETHGPLLLRFTADAVLCGEISVYEARSREDNLAAPFYRDGIRSLNFSPGIEAAEVETLVDQVLRVTSRNASDEDLVTLMWDAQLVHVDMRYVSTEAEVDNVANLDEAAVAAPTAHPAPWPRAEPAPEPAGTPAVVSTEAGTDSGEVRSDDWTAGHATSDLDASLRSIEADSERELERFRAEYQAELALSDVHTSIELAADCLDSGATALDRAELASFIPRLLREALGLGEWAQASRARELLRSCESERWTVEAFSEELAAPGSATLPAMVRVLDQQGAAGVQEFLTAALEFGPSAVEWEMMVLAESRQQRVRRPLTKVLAQLCKETPERLAPWMSDERWYVVRNVVHILGQIGGPNIVGLLSSAAKHSEPRVRQEVVTSLAQVGMPGSRPLLLEMLEGADTRMFCAVLRQLSSGRDPEIARQLLGFLQMNSFAERPLDECRAIYLALASVGGDEVLPGLEVELHRTKWFSQSYEPHRQSVARCISRIGTPAARAILEQAARSKNAAVRKAVQDGQSGGPGHE
jgi:hypothetical protein